MVWFEWFWMVFYDKTFISLVPSYPARLFPYVPIQERKSSKYHPKATLPTNQLQNPVRCVHVSICYITNERFSFHHRHYEFALQHCNACMYYIPISWIASAPSLKCFLCQADNFKVVTRPPKSLIVLINFSIFNLLENCWLHHLLYFVYLYYFSFP